jgi:hypothetical protein
MRSEREAIKLTDVRSFAEEVKHTFEVFQMFKISIKTLTTGKLASSASISIRLLEMQKLTLRISSFCKPRSSS